MIEANPGSTGQGSRLHACHGKWLDVDVAAVWPLRIPKVLDALNQS